MKDRIITVPFRVVLKYDGRRYAINEETGDPEPIAGGRMRKLPEPDVTGLQHKLMSIGARNKKDERREIAEFFNAAGYLRGERQKWREEDLTEAILERWRIYQKIVTAMALHPAYLWPTKIADVDWQPGRFPPDVLQRATRAFVPGVEAVLKPDTDVPEYSGPFTPAFRSEIETRDPLDAICVNIQLKKFEGIAYRPCQSRSCGKFFELEWRGTSQKRRRVFCSPTCASREQKARKADDLDNRCHRALRKALAQYRRIPAAKRTGNRSKDIEQLVRSSWPDFPRSKNYITHFLTKGTRDGQAQRS